MGNALQYFHHVLRTTIWPIKMHMSYVYIIVVIPLLQGLIQVKKKTCRNMRFWSSRRKCRHSEFVLDFCSPYSWQRRSLRVPQCMIITSQIVNLSKPFILCTRIELIRHQTRPRPDFTKTTLTKTGRGLIPWCFHGWHHAARVPYV